MPIDPDAPGRKAVFKMITDKLAYSNNTPEACVYCERKRGNKEEPLPLCGGCRSVRFCAYWPQHKAFCKATQKQKQCETSSRSELQGLAVYEHRRRILEDWSEVHAYSLAQARAWAFDQSTGQDNPSTSFSLESAAVLPVRGNPYPQIAIMLPLVESAEAEERARGTKGFLGNFICVYVIDGIPLWVSASYVYEDEIPRGVQRPADRPWHWFAEYCSRLGLVFRLVGPRSDSWKPGIMGKRVTNGTQPSKISLLSLGDDVTRGSIYPKSVRLKVFRSTQSRGRHDRLLTDTFSVAQIPMVSLLAQAASRPSQLQHPSSTPSTHALRGGSSTLLNFQPRHNFPLENQTRTLLKTLLPVSATWRGRMFNFHTRKSFKQGLLVETDCHIPQPLELAARKLLRDFNNFRKTWCNGME
ncbi:hypothetical protein B0H14DRAFT_2591862 [Mycena olivaceomarginata]|nr:hypothetical protein B0H14DRAFT_2591862 [Mycena olivaceomarginata]